VTQPQALAWRMRRQLLDADRAPRAWRNGRGIAPEPRYKPRRDSKSPRVGCGERAYPLGSLDTKPQVGQLACDSDLRAGEDDRVRADRLVQAHSLAEQHRRDVDHDLIEQALS
jgi:hypothetical protein